MLRVCVYVYMLDVKYKEVLTTHRALPVIDLSDILTFSRSQLYEMALTEKCMYTSD